MANKNDLEFEEHPLLYTDALRFMRRFEKSYEITSEDLFSALQRGEGRVEIDPDDLFEWRTYFDFTKEVEVRLKHFLTQHQEVEEVVYAATGCVDAPKRTYKDRKHWVPLVAA